MNTQGMIWIDGSLIVNLEKIRYIDLASIRCESSVETIYSN
jgi:hypothetical protein